MIVTEEFKKLRIRELEPFKWYRAKWSEPARYVATTGMKYGDTPIILFINHYVAATIEGEYKIKVDLVSTRGASIILAKDIKPEEKKYIKQAIKDTKIEVAKSIFYFVFSG